MTTDHNGNQSNSDQSNGGQSNDLHHRDGLFDDNVDLNPPFAPREIDAALRSVKIRGRRRRLLTAGPLALVMGSGLALVAFTLDLGGEAQVTQIGSDLGSSAALAPETGSESQGSSVFRDGSSVGDSYTSGPSQMTITPVPTLPAIPLDDGGLAGDQPRIQFDLTKILAPLALPTPEASSGVTVTTGPESDSEPTSTPTPPVPASAHIAADDQSDAASDSSSDDDAEDAADAGESASELSVETSAADSVADEPGSEPTPGSTSTDDPDVSASGTSTDSSSSADADADESRSGADPSTATMSTADDDSQTDLETEKSSAVDDLATTDASDSQDDPADPDGADSAVSADSADGASADGASADEDPPADADEQTSTDPDASADENAGDGAAADGAAAEAIDADADAEPAPDPDDPEGDGELVIIDANGDIITPGAEPTPVPQPVVLGASAEVSGFEIVIFISVLDGDGYSIGACGTTVNWGDGIAQDSACDPSCLAVDSSAPAAGVDGQLQFSHVYEVRNVQVAPYITVFTGLECYGDSSTVTFGPLLITDTEIVQS